MAPGILSNDGLLTGYHKFQLRVEAGRIPTVLESSTGSALSALSLHAAKPLVASVTMGIDMSEMPSRCH